MSLDMDVINAGVENIDCIVEAGVEVSDGGGYRLDTSGERCEHLHQVR